MNLMVQDGIKALLQMQSSKLQTIVTEQQAAIEELRERVQTEYQAQAHEMTDVRDKITKFSKAYEDLEKTTKEMRAGRGQRVDKDIENRKAVIELQHEMKKLRTEMEENT